MLLCCVCWHGLCDRCDTVAAIQQKIVRGKVDMKTQEQLERNRRKLESAQVEFDAERERVSACVRVLHYELLLFSAAAAVCLQRHACV